MKIRFLLAGLSQLTLTTICLGNILGLAGGPVHAASGTENEISALSHLSIPFVENQGQKHSDVAYYAPTLGGTFYVTRSGELVLALPASEQGELVSLSEQIVSEETISPRALGPSSTRVNYFLGQDPSNWRTHVPSYDTISLGEICSGIELSLKAYGARIEKIFALDPGADPACIHIRVKNAESLTLNSSGELILQTSAGYANYSAPIAFQEKAGERRPVSVAYQIKDDGYGFSLADYDPDLPLVIDPVLQSTFLGGSERDIARAVTFSATGAGVVYVAGNTESADFPVLNGYDETYGSGIVDGDVFVARLSSDLTTLLSATFLGSGGDETMLDGGPQMAVLAGTDVYVVGTTSSADFPGVILTQSIQDTKSGGLDVFIAHLNGDLDQLFESTFLGGGLEDLPSSIAVTDDYVYVTGYTRSDNFPTTVGAYTEDPWGLASWKAFVARYDRALRDRSIHAATYFGGNGGDRAYSIALHPVLGDVYIAGETTSGNLPATGGLQESEGGQRDAFIARFSPNLSVLERATYYGGAGDDYAYVMAITPDPGNRVFIAGPSSSPNLPLTDGNYQPNRAGDDAGDGFVLGITSDLQFGGWATYLGGSDGRDTPTALVLHDNDQVYVAGYTMATDFPGTTGGAQSANAGDMDAFIARLDQGLETLWQATYFGANSREMAFAMDVQPGGNGDLYLSGLAWSSSLPEISGGAQEAWGGGFHDAFVTRIDSSLALDLPAQAISVSPDSHDFGEVSVSTTATQSVRIANTGSLDLMVTSIYLSGSPDFTLDAAPAENPCAASSDDTNFTITGGDHCYVEVAFTPSVEHIFQEGALNIASDDVDNDLVEVNLRGRGAGHWLIRDVDLADGDVAMAVNPTNGTVHLCYYSGTELKHAQSDDGISWSIGVIHELDDPSMEYVDCALALDDESYGLNIAFLVREWINANAFTTYLRLYKDPNIEELVARDVWGGISLAAPDPVNLAVAYYDCDDRLQQGAPDNCWPAYSTRRLADGVSAWYPAGFEFLRPSSGIDEPESKAFIAVDPDTGDHYARFMYVTNLDLVLFSSENPTQVSWEDWAETILVPRIGPRGWDTSDAANPVFRVSYEDSFGWKRLDAGQANVGDPWELNVIEPPTFVEYAGSGPVTGSVYAGAYMDEGVWWAHHGRTVRQLTLDPAEPEVTEDVYTQYRDLIDPQAVDDQVLAIGEWDAGGISSVAYRTRENRVRYARRQAPSYAALSLAPRATKEDPGVGHPFFVANMGGEPLTITGVDLDTSRAGGVDWRLLEFVRSESLTTGCASFPSPPYVGAEILDAFALCLYATTCAPSSDVYAQLIIETTAGTDSVRAYTDTCPNPNIVADPLTMIFPDTEVGATNSLALEISNSGGGDLTVTEITSSNLTDYVLDLSGGTATCQPLPFTLAQDESCTIDITFRPSRIDIIGGELSIISNDPDVIDNPLVVTMLGVGVDEGQGSGTSSLFDCFIATAAYGSALHEDVAWLRSFRDQYLLTNEPGRAFVAIYYEYSPPIADYLRDHEALRTITRWMLAALIYWLQHPLVSSVGLVLLVLVPVRVYRIRKNRG